MTQNSRSSQPLHDRSKPVICTIEADRVGSHVALLERLREAAESITRVENGVEIRFENSRPIVAEVRKFVEEEAECCQFWGFEIGVSEAELTLSWDGPPVTAVFMDDLVGYFNGTKPIGVLFAGIKDQ